MRALHIAATGMSAQQMRVEVISNNLANMSTTGYNSRRAEFSDLHYQQVTRPGTVTAATGEVVPTGIQLGLGVRPTSVSVNLAQGSISQTGGDLDLAIEGRGYFEVQLPSGQAGFTRDGALKRSGDGLIVTSDGYAVAPEIVVRSGLSRQATALFKLHEGAEFSWIQEDDGWVKIRLCDGKQGWVQRETVDNVERFFDDTGKGLTSSSG